MNRKFFFGFVYDDCAINVIGQPLGDQQTAAIRALIELQGM